MQVWDRFYHLATDSFNLAPRVALEAVSRGGLYAYGWAKRNPDRVTCIYGEAPVCDFKSWPGGKGKGKGSSESWKQLLEVFGMTEAEAMAYLDNPIDGLEGLASFKVPLMHVLGVRDGIVPNEENTDILFQRYERLGGPTMVFPVTKGPQELEGHHFPIEHPEYWADQIQSNSYPVKFRMRSDDFLKVRAGISNALTVLRGAGGQFTVAFLGGSITYNPGWRDKVCRWFREKYPEVNFRFIAAGIPSLGSLPHAFRLQQDVLDSGRVDLMFVEAAVNDKANGTDSLTQLRALDGIVRHARDSNPEMDIVLMSFVDPDKIGDYQRGRVPVEVGNHERVAEHYELPSVNLALEVQERIYTGEFTWEDDFKDLHPSPFGQEIYFATIRRLMERCEEIAVIPSDKKRAAISPVVAGSLDHGVYVPVSRAKADGGWILDPDWVPTDGKETREGFVHCPVLMSATPGATLTLSFTGTAIGISIVSGPDAGKISWSIDHGKERTMDLFTPWSPYLHLPWYLLLDEGLSRKKHVLTIRVLGEKNESSKGTACRIVHFLVNG
jgi:sialidase-1